MKYMGSKNRISEHIVPIMLSERTDQWWVEPFVGGANIIDKVGGKRIGADADPNVIEALVAIRDHVDDLPKNNREFTEDDYNRMKKGGFYRYRGYAGFTFSFGGKWMGGWRRDSKGKRDYVKESYNNAKRQSPNIQGVNFVTCNYLDLQIPDNSILYCDPPYNNTSKYRNTDFNHEEFWQWCREKAKNGHTVFISEYEAPNDFVCIWQKELGSGLKRKKGKKRIEKLFVVKN